MEKGNRTVTFPNHGPNSEIPIGILRSIWSQVGLISILVICQEFLKKILIYFSGKRVTLIDLRRKIQRRTSVL
ncbi:hypothetical protein, partial [Enterocloster bolteae]|uniref:hypothetical protein n=1 Tax=Enterocloster bolteae TaxID=208479 RepID=UPI003AB6F1C2